MMASISNDRLALIYGLGAVGLWSTVATAFKLSLAHVSPLLLVTVASITSWIFLGALVLVTGEWRELVGLPRIKVLRLLLLGLLNPALYYFVLFAAYDRLPAQEAMALNYTWALVLPLLAAPLLRQTLQSRDIIAALISYFGVFIIATRGDLLSFRLSDPTGVGLAMGSTVIWALYWIANTRIDTPPVAGLFVAFTAAAGVLGSWGALNGDLFAIGWQGLAGGLYVGVFEMGVSFILWLQAMRLTRQAARISTLIFLSPPLSLVLIWGILGEAILPSTLGGLAFILLGLALQHLKRS